jgi:hypothetical protein
MVRELKVYGAAVSILRAERVALALPPHVAQARGVVMATSLTAAARLLGVSRDYVGESANEDDRAAAMREPGRVALMRMQGANGHFVVRHDG